MIASPFLYRSTVPRRRLQVRRFFRRQPGMANRSLSSVPLRNACTTSPTLPQTSAITRIPLAVTRTSNGHEIAPQTSTLTSSSMSLRARSCSAWLPRLSVRWLPSSSLARSTSKTCSATSNTGETRPCQSGTATFMSALQVLQLARLTAAGHPRFVPIASDAPPSQRQNRRGVIAFTMGREGFARATRAPHHRSRVRSGRRAVLPRRPVTWTCRFPLRPPRPLLHKASPHRGQARAGAGGIPPRERVLRRRYL